MPLFPASGKVRTALRAIKTRLRPIQTQRMVTPFNFYRLCESPQIVYTTTVRHLANVFVMSEMAKGRRMWFIVGFSWSMENVDKVRFLAREYRLHQRRYPKHGIRLICNAEAEYDLMLRHRLPALFVNKNAFLDPNIYRCIPEVEKQFDAIINSRMAPFKRCELARDVESLAVITRLQKGDEEYCRRVRQSLGHARWANYEAGQDYRALDALEVTQWVNRARTGLILSKTEGQCLASTEYLLCGVPVVSTPSKGGRDEFFDRDYVAIVEPTTEAVCDGVRDLISRDLTPDDIRKRTLKRIDVHRARFCDALNQVVASEGVPVRTQDEWFSGWKNKIKGFGTPAEFESMISGVE